MLDMETIFKIWEQRDQQAEFRLQQQLQSGRTEVQRTVRVCLDTETDPTNGDVRIVQRDPDKPTPIAPAPEEGTIES